MFPARERLGGKRHDGSSAPEGRLTAVGQNRKENVMKKKMRLGIRSAILAAVVLSGSADAWAAMSEDVFLGLLKKIGVTDAFETSKKPCLCTGGTLDRTVGLLVVVKSGARYKYDCSIPSFPGGGGGTCIGFGGGSLIPLSK